MFVYRPILKNSFFVLSMFLLLFSFHTPVYGDHKTPFQVEIPDTGKGYRYLRLTSGELGLEIKPVEVKPGFSVRDTLVWKKNRIPMDLEYVVANRTVKENLPLNEYRKIERITFEVKLKNLICKKENGLIGFYDQRGKRKCYLNRPYMKDMGDVNTDAVETNLRKEGNRLYVDLVPHDVWLKDKARVYTVRVVLPVGF